MDRYVNRIRPPDPPDVVVIHASAVKVDGEALIFTGRSGAGKSTICQVLSGLGEMLADDRIYLIRQQESRWIVADARVRAPKGPLSEVEVTTMKGVPLRAVFEIHKSPEPHVERVSAQKTCRYLTTAFFDLHYWSCHYDTGTKRASFAHMAAIARSVPGYDLCFNLSHQTPQVIRNELCL